MRQIARTETNTAINEATDQFYSRNPELESEALLVPASAACPACQAGVDANPWPSVRAAIAGGEELGMFHPGCVHYAEPIASPMAEDCSEIWRG